MMSELSSAVKVYHIHPRKTGGTAIRFYLQDILKPSHPLPFHSDFEFYNDVPSERQGEVIAASDLISGHFGRLGPLVPNDYLRICMLRDPLRRVVSEFNHMMQDPQDLLHEQIQGKTFCTAMRDYRFARQLCNHQARMLIENMGERYESLTDAQRIDCGIAFLSERVDCLGLLEHPAYFVSELERCLGVRVLSPLPHANSEVTAGGVGKATVYECLKTVVAKNHVDIALYSFVLAKLGF